MAKSKQVEDDRRAAAVRKEKVRSANSMGIVVADPAVKPRDVSIAKIRSAVSAITKK
jgi:hypothetical protein